MSKHVLIIEAPFYLDITNDLVNGVTQVLDKAKVTYERISVPGAYEIPGVVRFAEKANADRFDGYIAVGCVIRGETSHYDYVAGECCRGLMDLSLEAIAIGNGVLTVENQDQARVRSDVTQKNKGGDAAEACLAMMRARDVLNSGEKL